MHTRAWLLFGWFFFVWINNGISKIGEFPTKAECDQFRAWVLDHKPADLPEERFVTGCFNEYFKFQ